FFVIPGAILFFIALIPSIRYSYFHFTGIGGGHLQSLIGAAILFTASFVLIVAGFLAELIGVNRQLLEEIRWRMRERDYEAQRERDE
ncbi:MAG: glycosyltransferase family 2 protein, partial [Candidatus Hydrogenedentes bacterium]|nr:glycosyltransferase family 2 protein [Candidatus Hydrogenedentota bacterium]